MSSGDTAFVLVSAALVLLMTPGLAFFYGGLGRRKNVVNNMMASFFIMGVAIVLWIVVGYSLAFGGDHGGVIGGFEWAMFQGVGMDAGPYSKTIPHMAFAVFQMMFAVITPALITGAVAGRMRFRALFLFVILWTFVVYYPIAHMVWGQGGFLAKIGSVDFAGGNVVHISSGVTGLVLCLLLGKRNGYEHVNYRVHNIPFVALGAALLWFGWFGFNAGSALGANGLAAHSFTTTALSAAAAMVSWMLIDVIMNKMPTLVGASTGLVVGLVAITPGAGFVPVWAALIIGLVVSPICYFTVSTVKKKFGYDDALDAFGCHGIGGIWGGIATGLFARTDINSTAKWNGLVFGDTRLFTAQLLSIVITIAVAVVGTLICAAVVKLITPLRVTSRDEQVGLDLSQHGERAYPSFNGLDD
ncbi:MAG: ammonium transporter [Ruminococcaceae bacterium]|jgi:Amt family ammonium transporter|nr:ammonium transporter [Oscillospiraceae bacterium]